MISNALVILCFHSIQQQVAYNGYEVKFIYNRLFLYYHNQSMLLNQLMLERKIGNPICILVGTTAILKNIS